MPLTPGARCVLAAPAVQVLQLLAPLVSLDELPGLWHQAGADKMTPNDWGWDI